MQRTGEPRPPPPGGARRRRGPVWDAPRVRQLRQFLRLTQAGLAQELGTRQQTISEWETGRYSPRGASARLLSIVAERAGYEYRVEGRGSGDEEAK